MSFSAISIRYHEKSVIPLFNYSVIFFRMKHPSNKEKISLFIVHCSLFILCGCSQVVTYPAPEGEEVSPDFTVKVDGKEVFVYRARVSAYPENQVWPGYQRPIEQTEQASFCYFDVGKAVTVEIVSKTKIDRLTIRPLSKNIQPTINGDKITFTLSEPCQLAVEVNDYHKALHLFANAIEEKPVTKPDEHTVYFGPGIHYPGIIEVKDNQTVYIAGGAVVHALIKGQNVKNVTVKGRGIIDGSSFDREAGYIIRIENSENITVEGVILRDPPSWTMRMDNLHNVTIDNAKIIGLWRYNADGINIVNSNNVQITNSFIRSFDDCIVLRASNRVNAPQYNVFDVDVDNCVLWNDWGRAIEIFESGLRTVPDSIYRSAFRNCDIIHFVHIAFSIQNCDRAHIFDIDFENIRIEDPISENYFLGDPKYPEKVDSFLIANAGPHLLGHLFWIYLDKNYYSAGDSRGGKVFNINYKDIAYTSAQTPKFSFVGYDSEHDVSGITFDNVTVNGKKIRNVADGNMLVNDFVKDIKFY